MLLFFDGGVKREIPGKVINMGLWVWRIRITLLRKNENGMSHWGMVDFVEQNPLFGHYR